MDGLTIRLSAAHSVPYVVRLEPECMEHSVAAGAEVLITLPPATQDVEVVWRPEGPLIFRDVRLLDYPQVRTTMGDELEW